MDVQNIFATIIAGEHLAVLRRLAARNAITAKRDYFTVIQTCTSSQVALFKGKKAIFESLIKDSCTVKSGQLRVCAESVTLSIRKKTEH